MEKLPTAEELINDTGLCSCDLDTHGLMIKFAKIHVEAALQSICNGDLNDITEWDGNPYTGEGSDYLSERKIKQIYPLTNIK